MTKTEMNYDNLRDDLITAAFYVVDFLPRQVPADGGGQFFAVERYYMKKDRLKTLYRHFARILLKLNCYYDFIVGTDETWMAELSPKELHRKVLRCADGGDLQILLPSENALVTLIGGDLNMTVFNPTREILNVLSPLAAAESVFLWQPPQNKKDGGLT